MKQTVQDTCTIPTRDLIWDILGDDQNGLSCAPITYNTALILAEKLKGSTLWCVEFTDVDGETPLTYPILWRYSEWKTASSTYAKKKAYAEKLRVESWLLEANVNTLTKAILKKSPIPEKTAQSMAYMMVKNPDAMIVIQSFFGVSKLKTDVKEL